jgi:CheY-like chemotaxis protein
VTESNDVDILLVEDEPGDAELTSLGLKKKHPAHKLLVVRDGEEALEFLFGEASLSGPLPRLIILDLKLPKVDGLELLRKIRSSERTRGIPVVMYTSSLEEQDLINCYLAGANSYVQKPLDFDATMQRVGEIGSYWLNHNCIPERYPERLQARAVERHRLAE